MKFILEPDGDGEPTLWALENGDTDQYKYTPVLRRIDLAFCARDWWPDVVARMTGTTITNNDATVKRVAMALLICEAGPGPAEYVWDDWTVTRARAILAALTGVPHD